MKVWNSIVRRPSLLVAAGIVIGGASVAGIVSSARPAVAGPRIALSPISNLTVEAQRQLADLDSSFAALADYVSPAVVHIRVDDTSVKPNQGVMRTGGQGSGFIYRADGYIITNDHVVADANKVKVIMNDGRELEGTVIRANDPQVDVAIVKVNAKDLPTAQLADSDTVKTGQFALAFGAPYGLENSMTVGHISALGRDSAIPDARNGSVRGYTNLIQTDAPINPGNSGGPLVNVEGQVIGINTSIYSESSSFTGQGGNVGIGFALPSNQAKVVADILIEKGKLSRGYLGVGLRDLKPYEKKDMGIPSGAYVETVAPDSPASKAGLLNKDVVVRIGSTAVKDQQTLRLTMFKYEPGAKVQMEVLRGGKPTNVTVTVGAVPSNPVAATPLPDNGNGSRSRSYYWDEQSKKWKEGEGGGNGADPFKEFDNMVTPELREEMRKFRERNGDKAAPKSQTPNAEKPRFGVSIGDITSEMRKENNIPSGISGAYVGSVSPGSVAEQLGVRAGDVITTINGKAVSSSAEAIAAIKAIPSGAKISVSWSRFTVGGVSKMDASIELK